APGRNERAAGAPGMGDRLLVKFDKTGRRGEEVTEAFLIKKLGQSAHKVLGVIRKARKETRVEPVDRKSKDVLVLPEQEAGELKDGDLVLAEIRPSDRRYGPKLGKLLEVVGRED